MCHPMPTRIFPILSALVWMPWGIYRLLTPSSVAVSAGIVAHSATGTTELRAMYGGLQATLGILALIGVFADGLYRPALLAIALVDGVSKMRVITAPGDRQRDSCVHPLHVPGARI